MTTLNVKPADSGSKHFDVSGQGKILTVLDAGSESSSSFAFNKVTYHLKRETSWGDFK